MFEANVHSKSQIRWKTVSPECFQEVCAVLGEDYNIYRVQLVKQVDEWEQASNNYRVEYYREPGESSRQILLRRHILQGPDEIIVSTEVIRHLRQRMIPTPAVFLAYADRRFVKRGDQYWQMSEFVAGNHFSGEEGELSQVAMLIAEMHEALDTVSPLRWSVAGLDQTYPLDLDCWTAGHDLQGENAFEDFVMMRLSFLQEASARIANALLPVARKNEMIHADLHPQNFLFPPLQRCVVIDFGNICFADHRYDIAMALHRLVRQYVVYQGKPWQETLSRGIEIFVRAYGSIDPSVAQSTEILPKFMSALLLRKMAYNFGLYQRGARKWEVCLSQCTKFYGFLEEADAIAAILI